MSEQEQWEAVKNWLKQNGPWIVSGVAVGALALGGWRWWQAHVDAVALQASARYAAILEAFGSEDREKGMALIEELEREHATSPYVDQAHLLAARMLVDQGKLDEAAGRLQQVMQQTDDPELALVARMRLARVQADQGKLDEALATLNGAEPGAFAPRFHEIRGDVYYARGDKAAALKEYQAARTGDLAAVTDTQMLDLKINDLVAEGVSADSATASAVN